MVRSRKTHHQFAKFLIVGGIAFFIDASLLQSLVSVAEVSPFVARIFSFSGAVTFTWWMNRRYTFKSERSASLREFMQYITTQSLGLGINVGIYSLCLLSIDITATYPVIALVPATGVALIFNFVSMKKIVFKSV